MADTNLKKNKQGYGYQYTDLAQIHEYLEQNNMSYYQYVEPTDGKDYIMTVPIIEIKEEEKSNYKRTQKINNKLYGELEPRRGVQIVDAVLAGIKNPAQEQGSATTYARRYSLLMAFGLATEDDDGASLTKPNTAKKQEITTREQAEQYKITFGKNAGKTIKEIIEKDKDYANWLYQNGDDVIKKCLNFMLEKKE